MLGVRISQRAIRFERNPGAKPTFSLVLPKGLRARADRIAKDLDFSVSHAQGKAIAGVAYRARIGVDTELVRQFAPQTVRAFLTGAEFASLPEAGALRNERITLLWCLKEAYLKALGAGLRIHPNRIEIRPEGSRLRLLHDGAPVEAKLEWTVDPGPRIMAYVTIPYERGE